jgi:hypothetical protein
LLLTEVIWHTGVPSQKSDTDAETITGTILWFGGHKTLGLAATLWMLGGVVSTTVTVPWQESESKPSSTVRVTRVLPRE